ncbi:diguanylate cyclase with GAF sensor [Turneriella parva DSM 21527]|uniref:Diguanylate cyclase with GAF sensor n=2 Tax=Turneriella TaxID=338321 RepID=I4B338_TURPD|nr:diguanylate cyclase with GAF sensor [Turneriella parva DSM 21527]
MPEARMPANEAARLEALKKLRILDTTRAVRYDMLTEVAASIGGMDIAMINLIDSHRQWTKSSKGLQVTEVPRSISFCTHTINEEAPVVVDDLTTDPRFQDSQFVIGDPNLRSYTGIQLKTQEGFAIGTLCLLDSNNKKPDAEQLKQLSRLAACAMDMIERDAVAAELANSAKKSILFESVLKTYMPLSTWANVEESVAKGEWVVQDEELPLAVLMTDARGFTRFSEAHTPEQVVAGINRYYDIIVTAIFENDGEINKFVGDAVLALFTDPDAAVRAALRIQKEVSALSQELPDDERLTFRFGIHYGDVIRCTVGNYLRKEQTVIGDVVNTASRLEKACPPGKVFVSSDAYDRLMHKLPFSQRYRLNPKGKTQTVRAYMLP